MRKSLNLIELGTLIISGVSMLGGFWLYCESHFAHAEALDSEREARQELKGEIDALYLKLIPEQEKAPLHYRTKLNR